MPQDNRLPETRLARLEACTARLEERLNAAMEERREWKAEVLRRLAESNDNAKKLMDERARDRSELVRLDVYNSRHAELKTLAEGSYREMMQKIEALGIHFDQKLEAHERSDDAKHVLEDTRIQANTDWINNQKGRQWALGVGVALISGLVGVAVQIVFHIWSK